MIDHQFHPGPHQLDMDLLQTVELTVSPSQKPGCKLRKQDHTFISAYGAFLKEGVQTAINVMGCRVTTKTCEHDVSGPLWARRLLDRLLTLEAEGISAFASTWFFYHEEYCLHDPQEAFSFFLVWRDKIVADRATLFFDASGREDIPAFLIPCPPQSPQDETWKGQAATWDASVRAWYQHFYSSTHAGRVMVLRKDTPTLFHYKRRVPRSARRYRRLTTRLTALARPVDALAKSVRVMQQTVSIIAVLVLVLLFRNC